MMCVLCQLFNYLLILDVILGLGDHLRWCRFKLSFVNNGEKYVCSLHLWRTHLCWENSGGLKTKRQFWFWRVQLARILTYREMFCKRGWAVLLFLIPAALITRIWIDVFPLACLCVSALGENRASCLLCCGAGAWGRCVWVSHQFWAVKQRRTTGQTSYMSPVTAKSPITAAESVTRQWQSFSHAALDGWQSFMACGQAGSGWAALSAALRSSCSTGSRRDLHFRVRQTSHICAIVKMIVRPKKGTEQVVEGRSFAKQCENPALCWHPVCLFDV